MLAIFKRRGEKRERARLARDSSIGLPRRFGLEKNGKILDSKIIFLDLRFAVSCQIPAVIRFGHGAQGVWASRPPGGGFVGGTPTLLEVVQASGLEPRPGKGDAQAAFLKFKRERIFVSGYRFFEICAARSFIEPSAFLREDVALSHALSSEAWWTES